MKQIRAVLLKPLDGAMPGASRLFDRADFDRLEAMGALREAGDQDGIVDPDDPEVRAARAREEGWVAVGTHDALIADHLKRGDELFDLRQEHGRLQSELDGARQECASLREQLDASQTRTADVERERDVAIARIAEIERGADASAAIGADTQAAERPAPAAKGNKAK